MELRLIPSRQNKDLGAIATSRELSVEMWVWYRQIVIGLRKVAATIQL